MTIYLVAYGICGVLYALIFVRRDSLNRGAPALYASEWLVTALFWPFGVLGRILP